MDSNSLNKCYVCDLTSQFEELEDLQNILKHQSQCKNTFDVNTVQFVHETKSKKINLKRKLNDSSKAKLKVIVLGDQVPKIIDLNQNDHSNEEVPMVQEIKEICSSKDENSHECKLCKKTFDELMTLKLHLKFNHDPARSLFCDLCGQSCFNRNARIRHVSRVHKMDKPYKCDFCKTRFHFNWAVFRHILKRHFKITEKLSDVCEKYFKKEIIQEKVLETANDEENEDTNSLTDKKTYKCRLCMEDFTEVKQIKLHLKENHNPLKILQCEPCNKTFKSSDAKSMHLRRSHDKQRCYNCDFCDAKFFHNYNVSRHVLQIHFKIYDYQCDLCEKGFNKKHKFIDHKKYQHREKSTKLPETNHEIVEPTNTNITENTFETEQNTFETEIDTFETDQNTFETEQNTIENENILENFVGNSIPVEPNSLMSKVTTNFKCMYCKNSEEIFENIEKLKLHVKTTHIKSKMLVCDICDKTFDDQIEKETHFEDLHIDSKLLNCDLCEERFDRTSRLLDHIMKLHVERSSLKDDSPSYEILENNSSQKEMLNTHPTPLASNLATTSESSKTSKMDSQNSSIEDSRTFGCKVCNLILLSLEELHSHIKIHVEKQKLNCKICKEKFKSIQEKAKHFRTIHQKLVNFICDFCGKSHFKTSPILKRHIEEVHFKLYNFECNHCSMTFNRKVKLEDHINYVHKGLKNYVCQQCNKDFIYQSLLKLHLASLEHCNLDSNVNVSNEDIENQHDQIQLNGSGDMTELEVPKMINDQHEIKVCNVKSRSDQTSDDLVDQEIKSVAVLTLENQTDPTNITNDNSNKKPEVPKTKNDQGRKCRVCSKAFIEKWRCKQHEKRKCLRSQSNENLKCRECKKIFSDTWCLKRHETKVCKVKTRIVKAANKFSEHSNVDNIEELNPNQSGVLENENSSDKQAENEETENTSTGQESRLEQNVPPDNEKSDNLDHDDDNLDNTAEDQNKERVEGSKDKLKCKVCKKKFSNKDNRRRHERTICLAKRNTYDNSAEQIEQKSKSGTENESTNVLKVVSEPFAKSNSTGQFDIFDDVINEIPNNSIVDESFSEPVENTNVEITAVANEENQEEIIEEVNDTIPEIDSNVADLSQSANDLEQSNDDLNTAIEEKEEIVQVIPKQKNKLKVTMKKRHGGIFRHPIKCEFCYQKIHQPKYLKIHMKTHHSKQLKSSKSPISSLGKSYQCQICLKICSTYQGRYGHIRKSHPEYATKCDFCEKHFTSDTLRSSHMRKSHSERLRKPIVNIQRLRTKKGSFKCDVCLKVLKSSNAMVYHMKYVHQSERQTVLCKFCDNTYTTKDGLKHHLKHTHNLNKKEIMETCKELFNNKSVIEGAKLEVKKIPDGIKTKDQSIKPKHQSGKLNNQSDERSNQSIKLDDPSKKPNDQSKKSDDLSKKSYDQSKKSDDQSIKLNDSAKTSNDQSKTSNDKSKTSDDQSIVPNDQLMNLNEQPVNTNNHIKISKDQLQVARDQLKELEDQVKKMNGQSKNVQPSKSDLQTSKGNPKHVRKRSKLHICDICGQTFDRSSMLQKHKESKHSTKEIAEKKLFGCEKCGLAFKGPNKLQKHLRAHDQEKTKIGSKKGQLLEEIDLE